MDPSVDSEGIVGIYWFWGDIESFVTQSTTNITSRTISNIELQTAAVEASKKLFLSVLKDEYVINTSQQFLFELLKSRDTLDVLQVLLADLVVQPKGKLWSHSFSAVVVTIVLIFCCFISCPKNIRFNHEKLFGFGFGFLLTQVVDSLKQLVINVFNDDVVLGQCKYLIGTAIDCKENQEKLVIKNVRTDTTQLSKDTVTNLLQDKDVQKLALFFMIELMRDNNLQQQTSNTLFDVVVKTVTPVIFSKSQQTPPTADNTTNEVESLTEKFSTLTAAFQIFTFVYSKEAKGQTLIQLLTQVDLSIKSTINLLSDTMFYLSGFQFFDFLKVFIFLHKQKQFRCERKEHNG
ncbi:hypothetical protein RFI_06611 [Reticulomyxa filosa]|uniref:Uncharacterized protein n=1 Tax=Reticulomyxa filosa TaxID=46433 RepID=X6NXG0_RETFI|nr:hypothetical protein RFI_06611 [Reticulomyxa filosa]|eukprot:ETO30509.1 hypothetical protein RFI_06611 [Reticulomyxa filosa]